MAYYDKNGNIHRGSKTGKKITVSKPNNSKTPSYSNGGIKFSGGGSNNTPIQPKPKPISPREKQLKEFQNSTKDYKTAGELLNDYKITTGINNKQAYATLTPRKRQETNNTPNFIKQRESQAIAAGAKQKNLQNKEFNQNTFSKLNQPGNIAYYKDKELVGLYDKQTNTLFKSPNYNKKTVTKSFIGKVLEGGSSAILTSEISKAVNLVDDITGDRLKTLSYEDSLKLWRNKNKNPLLYPSKKYDEFKQNLKENPGTEKIVSANMGLGITNIGVGALDFVQGFTDSIATDPLGNAAIIAGSYGVGVGVGATSKAIGATKTAATIKGISKSSLITRSISKGTGIGIKAGVGGAILGATAADVITSEKPVYRAGQITKDFVLIGGGLNAGYKTGTKLTDTTITKLKRAKSIKQLNEINKKELLENPKTNYKINKKVIQVKYERIKGTSQFKQNYEAQATLKGDLITDAKLKDLDVTKKVIIGSDKTGKPIYAELRNIKKYADPLEFPKGMKGAKKIDTSLIKKDLITLTDLKTGKNIYKPSNLVEDFISDNPSRYVVKGREFKINKIPSFLEVSEETSKQKGLSSFLNKKGQIKPITLSKIFDLNENGFNSFMKTRVINSKPNLLIDQEINTNSIYEENLFLTKITGTGMIGYLQKDKPLNVEYKTVINSENKIKLKGLQEKVTSLKDINIEESKILTETQAETKPISKTRSKTRSSTIQVQTVKPISDVITTQKTPINKISKPKPTIKPKTPSKPVRFPSLNLNFNTKPVQTNFKINVGQKGNIFTKTFRGTNLNKVTKAAIKYTDTTPAASFKFETPLTQIQTSKVNKLTKTKFKRSKKDKKRLIELSRFRIDTSLEKLKIRPSKRFKL